MQQTNVRVSTDPTPVQLIIQFLEQASKPSVNEQNQVQPPADNRRNRTLKLLALKVAAHMKWDLDLLEKGYVGESRCTCECSGGLFDALC